MDMLHSDSKTDLKPRCDCCIKIPAIRGAHNAAPIFMTLCCMLLPQKPYILPQHKRQVCKLSCSCKHQFLWTSQIFRNYFCLINMVTVRQWQTFGSRKIFRFIGQRWYLNTQWTPEQAIFQARCVRAVLDSREKCAHTSCLLIYPHLWRHLRGGWELFLLLTEA